jgi:hypothetical protein
MPDALVQRQILKVANNQRPADPLFQAAKVTIPHLRAKPRLVSPDGPCDEIIIL